VDRSERIRETFLAPAGTVLLSRDSRVVERDGWYQIITPTSGSTLGNEVVWSRVPAAGADEVVRRTMREYDDAGVPFKWCVGPLTEPAEFGSVLERHGFVGWDVLGMAIAPSAWQPSRRAGVVVEPVTAATVDVYYQTFVAGWGDGARAPDPARHGEDLVAALATGRLELFLARVDGAPAGTAGTLRKPRSGYLIGGNVLPAYRGAGVYRALLDERLGRLAAAGVPLATTQARAATSAPILARLGFEHLYDSRVYRSRPE
jgi:GNAT superfamily N-acetyltransferase